MDACHRPDTMAGPGEVFRVSRFTHQIVLEAEVVAEDDVAAVLAATLGQTLTQSSWTGAWEILQLQPLVVPGFSTRWKLALKILKKVAHCRIFAFQFK